MEDESPERKITHVEKAARGKRNNSLRVRPGDSTDDWPANLGEILEWYNHEVEDVTRAAQMRLRSASKVIADYREGTINLEEATQRVYDHDSRWGQKFPGGIEDSVRGRSDEEVDRQLALARPARRGRG